ncbi:hypothetical protein DYJ42_06105 [Streptococcus constellatus]|uniref:Uncharacterized protein n=2 Tax=Streptococcus constellatus TaxID=76860 RepID=A0A0C1K776_STRCV|nr:hypothetical protein RN79_04975 [Streptococcus constellatus]RID96211.1 hypothetical protein DYJ42_06105 [Streptococcus constellatus]
MDPMIKKFLGTSWTISPDAVKSIFPSRQTTVAKASALCLGTILSSPIYHFLLYSSNAETF